MGYKEYLESIERTQKKQVQIRHCFFAQHPELVGTGILPLNQPQGKIKPIYQDMEWTPRQWDAVHQLTAQVLHLDNKVRELLSSKSKKRQPKWT